MTNNKAIAIIPARYGSSRFPGKVVANLGGKPVIQYIWETATSALGNDSVWIATDNIAVESVAKQFTNQVVMTDSNCRCGTERCFQAMEKIDSDAEIIINLQADEPFARVQQISSLVACFSNHDVDIATLCHKFNPALGYEALSNPNRPKVVRDNKGLAMMFSRSVIPFVANHPKNEWLALTNFFTHIGMYAFRHNVLKEVVELPPSQLELAENLEQLRWMQSGYKIMCVETPFQTIGIDTPEDLLNAEKYLQSNQKD